MKKKKKEIEVTNQNVDQLTLEAIERLEKLDEVIGGEGMNLGVAGSDGELGVLCLMSDSDNVVSKMSVDEKKFVVTSGIFIRVCKGSDGTVKPKNDGIVYFTSSVEHEVNLLGTVVSARRVSKAKSMYGENPLFNFHDTIEEAENIVETEDFILEESRAISISKNTVLVQRIHIVNILSKKSAQNRIWLK